jgi:hypothetical protein
VGRDLIARDVAVSGDGSGRGVGLARADGVVDGLVLLDDGIERRVDQLVVGEQRVQGRHVPVEHVEQPVIAAPATDLLVEGQVQPADRRPVTGGGPVLQRLQRARQPVQRALVAARRQQVRGPAFDRGAQVVDLADVLPIEQDDECAPAGRLVDEAFGRQHLERLADRAPADPQTGGQLRLDEVRPVAEVAGQDLLAQDLGGVRRQLPGHRDRRQVGQVAVRIRGRVPCRSAQVGHRRIVTR